MFNLTLWPRSGFFSVSFIIFHLGVGCKGGKNHFAFAISKYWVWPKPEFVKFSISRAPKEVASSNVSKAKQWRKFTTASRTWLWFYGLSLLPSCWQRGVCAICDKLPFVATFFWHCFKVSASGDEMENKNLPNILHEVFVKKLLPLPGPAVLAALSGPAIWRKWLTVAYTKQCQN